MDGGITPRSSGFLKVNKIGATMIGGIRADVYRVGGARVLQNARTHFSISCDERDPTWEEIASARYALLPRLRDCVMLLPPDDEYVNLHAHCFHIHMLRTLAPGERFHNPDSW